MARKKSAAKKAREAAAAAATATATTTNSTENAKDIKFENHHYKNYPKIRKLYHFPKSLILIPMNPYHHHHHHHQRKKMNMEI